MGHGIIPRSAKSPALPMPRAFTGDFMSAVVEVDDKKFAGTLKALPDRDQILPDINENLVVELYSK